MKVQQEIIIGVYKITNTITKKLSITTIKTVLHNFLTFIKEKSVLNNK